jgi:AcrR family transcriptional regulator
MNEMNAIATNYDDELLPLRRDTRGPTKRMLAALETKNRLFEISIRLFSKFGYEAVTIDDITERAGVSKGTFYTHFDSKDAILVEQFKKIDDAYTEAFKDTSGMSAKEMLMLLMKTMCDYCADVCGINVMKIVYMNQISLGGRPDILSARNRTFYGILEQVAEKGKKSGEFFNAIDTEEFVMLISRAARALIYDWCLFDGSFDLKTQGIRQFALICDSLRPK